MTDPMPRLGPTLARAVLRRRNSADQPGSATLSASDQAVDPEQLWRYQQLCGFAVSDLLPPSYPHLMAFPLMMARFARPDFPFPVLGLVHLINQLRQYRPVRSSERLDLSVRLANRREHPAGELIDLITEASSGAEPVWQETSSYLHRSGTHASRRPEPAPVEATIGWDVPADIGRRYAAISGDRNPIHLHRLTARPFGFRRPIAHGMWLLARTMAAFQGRLPDAFELTGQFQAPVLLPARVLLRSDRPIGQWDFSVHDARTGKPHLTGAVRGS
jgi:acyl dehydratase